jgi:hypothetical protein
LVKGQPKITGAKEPTPLWNQTRASQRVCDLCVQHPQLIEYNLFPAPPDPLLRPQPRAFHHHEHLPPHASVRCVYNNP